MKYLRLVSACGWAFSAGANLANYLRTSSDDDLLIGIMSACATVVCAVSVATYREDAR